MKVKDLIAKLQTLPPETQIMLWDGWEREFNTRIRVEKSRAIRFFCTAETMSKMGGKKKWHGSSWKDYDPCGNQSKEIVCIQATDNTGRREHDR